MNINSLNEILIDLNQKIVDLDNSISEQEKELEKNLNNILKSIELFEKSWSGHWLKAYANLYFDNLQEPPSSAWINPRDARWTGISEGWKRLGESDVEKIIEELCKISLSKIREEVENYVNRVSEVRDHLCVELSLIEDQPKFMDEVDELKNLEKLEWGISIQEFISYVKPKNIIAPMSDIQMGFDVPPHIQYQAIATHLLTKNSSGLDFIKRAKKLIRKIEIKANLNQEQQGTLNSIENIVKICNSFHTVARQLRQRHSNRDTLTIQDEYDVQDLFHALLRIFFEDVREEETTPSYAGGSSRVDFLLPQEKIVVELKKTRKGLGAREVGSQLLIDIARYQSHPDCRNLICFVYDPEGIIGNPKGLEKDLNDRSNETINIVAIIRPL